MPKKIKKVTRKRKNQVMKIMERLVGVRVYYQMDSSTCSVKQRNQRQEEQRDQWSDISLQLEPVSIKLELQGDRP